MSIAILHLNATFEMDTNGHIFFVIMGLICTFMLLVLLVWFQTLRESAELLRDVTDNFQNNSIDDE